jgi:hypothetical protein
MSLIHPSLAADMIIANFPTVLVQDGVSDVVPDGVPYGVSDEKTPCDFSL